MFLDQLCNFKSITKKSVGVEGVKVNKGFILGGFSLGTLVAVALSWGKHHDILWAIIHGFFSWFYVVYYLLGAIGSY